MTTAFETGDQLLVPIPQTRHALGDIGLTKTYQLVKDRELEVVHIGRRAPATRWRTASSCRR